jgi:hypothetical protein
VDVLASDMKRHFRFPDKLVRGQDHVGIDNVVEVTDDPVKLVAYIASNRRAYV